MYQASAVMLDHNKDIQETSLLSACRVAGVNASVEQQDKKLEGKW